MTTAASRKTHLEAIITSRCRDDDTFVTFQPMGIFRFWIPGECTFFPKMSTAPSIFLGPHPLPSQVFRFALASSSLAILSLRSTIDLKYKD